MKKIEEVVENLGKLNCEQIFELFKSKNIKGRRGKACNCPVSNYLPTTFDKSIITEVSQCFITVYSNFAVTKHIFTPTSVAKFISMFDNGLFPELEYKS